MKNKNIILTLFLFLFLTAGMAFTPALFNINPAHADSDDDDAEEMDDDFFDDDSDDDDDEDDDSRNRGRGSDDSDDDKNEIRERYRYEDSNGNEYRFEERIKFNGALGIPVREEVRSEVRVSSDEIKIKDRVRVRQSDDLGWTGLRIMLANWGECKFVSPSIAPGATLAGTPPLRNCTGDVNEDGSVDFSDIADLIETWGDDDSRTVAKSVIETCQREIGDDLQKRCLLRTMQEEEVKVKTATKVVAWQPREDDDDSNDDSRGRSVEKRVENYLKHMSNMVTRMYAAVERLEVLADRIESRISKFEEAGADMTTSKELLSDAREKIESARDVINNLSESYEEAIEVEDPKTFFDQIKAEVQEIRRLLNDVHLSLIEVVSSIKGSSNDDDSDDDTKDDSIDDSDSETSVDANSTSQTSVTN